MRKGKPMRRLWLSVAAMLVAAGAQANPPPGTIMTSGTATSHSVSLPLGHMPGCTPTAGAIEAPIVPPTTDFDGITRVVGTHCDSGKFASDDNGAIGPNHYVQVVNFAIAVFDRAGSLLAGPLYTTTFWKNQPTCGGTQFWTDSVVIYDQSADRWVISRPGGPKGAYLCLAVSQTSDPTGQWDQYAFAVNNSANGLAAFFNDYPKIAAWPGSYLATANPNKIFSGVGNTISAFDRAAMLAGHPKPAFVTFFVPAPAPSSPGAVVHSHMLAANLDGATAPPAGGPAYIVQVQDSNLGFLAGRLQLLELKVNWSTPAAATLNLGPSLAPAAFNSNACPWPQQSCIVQPPPGPKLDSLSYGVMMFRLSYRNFATHQSLLLNHTVAADGVPSHDHAGIRWYELRQTGKGAWTIYQQETYAPDANDRWLGSIAMDRLGNILLAFDVSGPKLLPSIHYAGRLVGNPLGQLPLGEGVIQKGAGMQTGTDIFFGDYSALTVDPNDDCTFWDTNTYYRTTTPANQWHTRIAAIRFPDCQ